MIQQYDTCVTPFYFFFMLRSSSACATAAAWVIVVLLAVTMASATVFSFFSGVAQIQLRLLLCARAALPDTTVAIVFLCCLFPFPALGSPQGMSGH